MKSQSALSVVRELEQAGVRIRVYACDVSDFEQLDQTLRLWAREMPPIRGVIQTAMALKVSFQPSVPHYLQRQRKKGREKTSSNEWQDTIIDKMTFSEYQQALHPKVAGTRNLLSLLSSATLNFFILLSSCAAIIGNRGQGNYASACTFQDAFARYKTGLSMPTRSLNLSIVESARYVSENLDSLRFLIAKGFTPVTLSVFLALLNYAISTPVDSVESSQLIVGLPRLDKAAYPSKTFIDAEFSHLVTFQTAGSAGEGGAARGAEDASSSLQRSIKSATPTSEVHRLITCAIFEKLSQVLVLPVEDISPLHAILGYGGDSLAAVELRNCSCGAWRRMWA